MDVCRVPNSSSCGTLDKAVQDGIICREKEKPHSMHTFLGRVYIKGFSWSMYSLLYSIFLQHCIGTINHIGYCESALYVVRRHKDSRCCSEKKCVYIERAVRCPDVPRAKSISTSYSCLRAQITIICTHGKIMHAHNPDPSYTDPSSKLSCIAISTTSFAVGLRCCGQHARRISFVDPSSSLVFYLGASIRIPVLGGRRTFLF